MLVKLINQMIERPHPQVDEVQGLLENFTSLSIVKRGEREGQ